MTIDWCRQPETGLPAPDVVLFLDLSEKKVAERRQFGEERYEVPEFQKRVLKVYEKLKDDKWQVNKVVVAYTVLILITSVGLH